MERHAELPPAITNQPGLHHYLLLDGVKLQPLERWLYEQLESPHYEPLYLSTPLHECRRLSPCLVQLTHHDALWQTFMTEGASQGWGWAFSSSAPFDDILQHLRWLLFVEHPHNATQILCFSQPAVMHGLLEAEPDSTRSALLGPMQQVWIPVSVQDSVTWYAVDNARPEEVSHHERFRLQHAHLEAFKRLAWQRFSRELGAHLATFFSDGSLLREHGTAIAAAEHVIHVTQSLGFTGRRAHFHLANILGAHGDCALDAQVRPSIAAPLLQPDGRPPMERLLAASAAAEQAMLEGASPTTGERQ
ncbi:DUF4123 domain-containing protein [Vreelandella stevensii]|uniref:DUF4123 domain-containing protein n=1 Tax=Vreelandella stevensii TaxID=502821 RepID=UPI00403B0EBB